jgi:hypothetical protein
MELMILFLILLLCVAFLYASVGHGGASGYLALMAIFSIAPDVMKPTALLLNLFVSMVAFIQFYRGGHFHLKLFLPFAITSIPFSFIGGLIVVDGQVYKQILGLLLLVPIVRFLAFKNGEVNKAGEANVGGSLLIGSIIGFLSGLIGIGGGILLSPVILLLGWAGQKQTAAVSALFIFVNSLAGLGGQLVKGVQFSADMYLYVLVAFAGGLGGAYFGSMRLPQRSLKGILALVLLLASYKLLFTQA